MNDNSEIPCSLCPKRDTKTRVFSCKPNECQRLSKWLFEHAKIAPAETIKVDAAPIQYVV